ncbi:MAG: S8 family serine peptidase, partial [Gemmatimonadota bacterium]
MSGPVPALDLTQYTGAGVRVAVVDSGIDPLAADVGAVAGGVSLSLDAAGPVRRGVCLTDHLGHGTACAGIIRRLAPGVELHAVRIFDEALVADGKLLVAAIDWAVEAGMQVVNLSLGTTDPSLAPDLARVCGRAVEAGVLLVAAEHNDGLESYPASLPGVVGVRAGKVHTRHGYRWLDDSRIECEARGDAQRVTWLGGRQVMLGGSSLAAPHVSAVAALVREALPEASVAEVRAALRDCATAVVSARTPAAARDSGRCDAPPGPRAASFTRAALYPFSKEMHAFVRFRDLLPFQIAAVGDPVGCGRTGRDAAGVVALEPMGVPVTPGLGRAVEGCDGLVLGYLDRLGRLRQRDLVRESLELALDRRLHVFSFQALNSERYGPLLEAAHQEQLRWRWPAVTAEQARDVLRGDPPGGAVDVPVLAVMGTSASQGKFTLQLALRRELLGRGYELGQ